MKKIPVVHLMEGRKEANVSFIKVLDAFYLQLYGVKYTVKNHTDNERGNPLSPLQVATLSN